MSAVIDVSQLSKQYGSLRAVDNLSFTVEAGSVVGFLGPNGSGKTTTIRMILGQVEPNSGDARINGQRYRDLRAPLTVVGASFDSAAFHPRRSGRDHLRILARQGALPPGRVDTVLDLVGLSEAGSRAAGTYSMGMRQRLALAGALLGDPDILLLDEPTNGLDPEGVRWLRQFLRQLAGEGRSILVSSHLLSEVAMTVDEAVIIGHGTLLAQWSMAQLATAGQQSVRLRSPHAAEMMRLLTLGGHEARHIEGQTIEVEGLATDDIGDLAAQHGFAVHELTPTSDSLETAFFRLTGEHGAMR